MASGKRDVERGNRGRPGGDTEGREGKGRDKQEERHLAGERRMMWMKGLEGNTAGKTKQFPKHLGEQTVHDEGKGPGRRGPSTPLRCP